MRTQSRPKAGPMKKTIGTKVSQTEYLALQAMAEELDRPVSWLIRNVLIQSGLIEAGK